MLDDFKLGRTFRTRRKPSLHARNYAALLFAVLAIMLWILHRANIARLVAGTESKIGQKQ